MSIELGVELRRRQGGVLAAAAVACLLAGLAAATGRASLALAGAGLLLGGVVAVGERRRVVLLLWGGVAFTAPFNGVRVSSILAVSDVLLVLALAASLPDVVRSPRRGVVPPLLAVALGIVVGAGLVGTFFAQDVAASLSTLAKIVLAAAGSVMALALWDPGAGRLRQFAWLWFAGATTSAVVGLVTPPPVVGRAIGLTNHPNHFGLVCLLAVGLGIGLAFSSSGWPRLAAWAASGLLVVGVGVSGSRSALVGLAVTIVAAALLTSRVRLLVATGVAMVVAAMALVAGVVHLPDANALSRLGSGDAASDAGRRQNLRTALDTLDRHPFTGEGFEFAQAAHSIYLQALVVGGPVALAGFLWLCWTIGRVGVRGARARDGGADGLIVAGLTAGFAGYLTSGTFDNILWDRYLWTYLGLLIVLAGTMRLDRHGAARGPEVLAAPARPALDRAGRPAEGAAPVA